MRAARRPDGSHGCAPSPGPGCPGEPRVPSRAVQAEGTVRAGKAGAGAEGDQANDGSARGRPAKAWEVGVGVSFRPPTSRSRRLAGEARDGYRDGLGRVLLNEVFPPGPGPGAPPPRPLGPAPRSDDPQRRVVLPPQHTRGKRPAPERLDDPLLEVCGALERTHDPEEGRTAVLPLQQERVSPELRGGHGREHPLKAHQTLGQPGRHSRQEQLAEAGHTEEQGRSTVSGNSPPGPGC